MKDLVRNIDVLRKLYLFSKYKHRRPDFFDDEFFQIYRHDISTPNFLTPADKAVLTEYGDHSFICLEDTYTCFIDPPNNINEISFTLVDCHALDEIEIVANATLPNGETAERSLRFTNGDHGNWNLIPVSLTVPKAIEIQLDIRPNLTTSLAESLQNRLLSKSLPIKAGATPWMSVPSVRPAASESSSPPFFLISVDSLRYDHLHLMQSLIDAFDGQEVIPSEPRTQGHFTRTSHGSILTGTYPGDHQYYSRHSRLSSKLVTLPEVLTEQMYKCSACVSFESLRPKYGLTVGFQRFMDQYMSWTNRSGDAADVVETITRWINKDVKDDIANQLFYFLHLFDTHYPYFDPHEITDSGLDVEMIESYGEMACATDDYLSCLEGKVAEPSEETINCIQTHYEQSVQFVSRQLERLLDVLKANNIFNEALIIILGDHGEEFFERGFGMHHTLYDANIRPAMIVKLPTQTQLTVPDDPDFIDIMPTIAKLVTDSVPKQCDGRAWQDKKDKDYRIAERLDSDIYGISVECKTNKGIFTYSIDKAGRPSPAQVEDGPIAEEYYSLSAVRNEVSDIDQVSVSSTEKQELLNKAQSFLNSRINTCEPETNHVVPPSEVKERLKKLGYR